MINKRLFVLFIVLGFLSTYFPHNLAYNNARADDPPVEEVVDSISKAKALLEEVKSQVGIGPLPIATP